MIILIHSAAPSLVVVPDKESPHVPTRESRVAVAHVDLYVVVQSWLIDRIMHDKQGKKMQPVQVVVGEAVITWPGAGRCRRTIVDVDEPSKKRQLFIFGLLCVCLPSDYED